jgi:hypothetical protein
MLAVGHPLAKSNAGSDLRKRKLSQYTLTTADLLRSSENDKHYDKRLTCPFP